MLVFLALGLGCIRALTGTAQALLSDTQEHGPTEVAVGWLLEVFQPPCMLTIILYILQGKVHRGS